MEKRILTAEMRVDVREGSDASVLTRKLPKELKKGDFFIIIGADGNPMEFSRLFCVVAEPQFEIIDGAMKIVVTVERA